MKTLMIAASALALSTPALAQMEPATPSATTTQSTTTTTQTPPVDPAAPATTTSETTTTTVSDPKALIASEFLSYDKDASGALDKTEFAGWMSALKAKSGAKPMAPAEMTKWSDGAFATADKDKSKTVTLVELQTYLTQGA
jgi:hypothetical protein